MKYPQKQAKSPLPLHNLITERWSPRAFAEMPVEAEKLQVLFEAARWAASSRNEQPWRFIVAQKHDDHYERLYSALNEGNQKWAHTAPVLCASLVKRHFDYKHRQNNSREHDLGLAMGNLSLQATAEGLHLHQMAGFDPDKLLREFEIDTEEYQAVTMFVVGYQDFDRLSEIDEHFHEGERGARERKPLAKLVSGAKFGEAPAWFTKD